MKRTQLVLFILLMTLGTTLLGQGWERTFGGTGLELGYSVLQTANGDFIACGYSTSFGNGTDEEVYIVRTDIDGNTIWEQTHTELNSRVYGQSLIETSDGNYLIAGYIIQNNTDEDLYLLKVDPDGEFIWSSIIQGPGEDFGFRVIETADNGFAIIGDTRDILTSQRDIYFVKTDALGQEIWNKRIGDVLFDVAYDVIQTADEDYLIAGYQTTIAPNDTIREAVLIRTDSDGEPTNTYSLGETVLVSGAEVVPADNNGFVVAVYNDFSVFLKKVSDTGTIEWSEEMPDMAILPGASLTSTPDGGYALVGSRRLMGQMEDDLLVVKTNALGEITWDKTFGSPINDDVALGVCNAAGGGFGVIGYTRSFGAGFFDFYLLHTDDLGNTLNNFVRGNVYYDLDEQCDFDAGEYGLNDWLLEVTNDENTYYGLTDEDGNYLIAVDSGSYTLNLVLLNDYWQSCGNNFNLSLNGPYDTATVDFPLQSVYDCPLLEVDISTPFLRRCFDNTYTVNYCNDGTILVEDAQVEVELDEYLIFNDASIMDFSVDGNTYTFEVGDLDVNECGTFYIDVTVDCDSTLLGQSHCVEAHITPDSICTPTENCWEGGSVELDAICDGDSVRFIVNNVGTAIDASLGYIIIEDFVILYAEPFDNDIEAEQFEVISVPVEGQTLRIEVDQPPCHPGNSTPTITVEGCGLVDESEVSLGYLTQYYENDGNPFVSIDCQENIGSWDPNDKRGYPKGYEDQHYIEANTELDYLIRFQNTGSDTAFRVVIRDTISEWLNVRDIQAGASSHPYDMEIYGENILKFTFENIELPDSTTNEVASHGFVKFRIAQQLNNLAGTVIPNSAAIYFDYNEPVITNETWHTIGEDYIEVSTDFIPDPGVYVKYYPNPFDQVTTFEISYDNEFTIPAFETKTFHLFDTQGRLIRSEQFDGNQFQFLRNGLATGLYFFEIEAKNKLIIGGKLIAH